MSYTVCQDQFEDANNCLTNRKLARAAFTRTGSTIISLIESRGSRTELQDLLRTLNQRFDDAWTCHYHYVKCANITNEKTIAKNEAWVEALRDDRARYVRLAETYLELRSDDSASPKSTTDSEALDEIKNTKEQIIQRQIEMEKLMQLLKTQEELVDQRLNSNQIEVVVSVHEPPSTPNSSSSGVPRFSTSTIASSSTSTPISSVVSSPIVTVTSVPSCVPSSINVSAPMFQPTTSTVVASVPQHNVRFSVPYPLSSTSLMLGQDLSYVPYTSQPAVSSWPISSAGAPHFVPTVTHRGSAGFSVPHQFAYPRADSWIQSVAGYPPTPPVNFQPPKMKVPKFAGDPREWLNFSASFFATIHRSSDDNVYRLTMLRESLSPKVRQTVEQYLYNPNLYHLALQELQRIYGNPDLIVNAHLDALEHLNDVPENDATALQEFVAVVNGAVSALISEDHQADLSATRTINMLAGKLPTRILTYWATRKTELQELNIRPTVVHFIECMKKVVNVERELSLGKAMPPNDSGLHYEPQKKTHDTRRNPKKTQKGVVSAFATQISSPSDTTSQCLACDAPHDSATCKAFLRLSLDEKIDKIRGKKACYRCLGRSHRSSECKRETRCGIDGCQKAHHPAIHGCGRIFPSKSAAHPSRPSASAHTASSQSTTTVNANTIIAEVLTVTTSPDAALNLVQIVIEANGKRVKTFALLDNGCSSTIIHDSIATALNLAGTASSCRLGTVNGIKQVPCSLVSFSIQSVDGSAEFYVRQGVALEHSDMPRRSFNPSKLKLKWPHLVDLEFDHRNTIQAMVIIGRNLDRALHVYEKRYAPDGSDGPNAERTAFGWSIVGPIKSGPDVVSMETFATVVSEVANTSVQDTDLLQLGSRSLELDSIGISPRLKPAMSPADRHGLSILQSRTTHNGERYTIGLMWKSLSVNLPDNYSSAFRRLLSLERKFKANPEMASRYAKTINEYISLGHARKLLSSELPLPPGKHWYLPHLAVEQPNKTRVVFDLSAKHQGICLNDVLLKGPDLLCNPLLLLTKFRLNLIALTADIEKMYHQVLVEKDEQYYFAFLWRQPGSASPPETYAMVVHIFGAVSSPATCMFALRKTSEDFRHLYPDVADLVLNNFYVDNYLDSVDSEEEAIQRQKNLTALLKLGGFNLTKWLSSSRTVLSKVSPESRSKPQLDITFDELPTEKTLGLLWNSSEDSFRFHLKPHSVSTKRELLRAISSVFDPLGMLAPVILKARLILKKLWISETPWDTPLPRPVILKWEKWSSSLSSIESVRITRCLKNSSSTPVSRQLHCFCDASPDGYGAVMYLRTVYPSGIINIAFVLGKSRVSPIKFTSIHRLELQAALLGARLASSLLDALELRKNDAVFWSDSQTVLKWFNSKTMKFHTFVANRVTDVLDLSDVGQWRYVPTTDNPADDCSRGLYGSKISSGHRWFTGPKFLSLQEASWPTNIALSEPKPTEPEVAGPISAFAVTLDVADHPITSILSRSSKWTKCLRVVARMLRLFPRNKHLKQHEYITKDELAAAELVILWHVQQEAFGDDIKTTRSGKDVKPTSPLARLTPFLNDVGLLCVGGRLQNSDLPVSAKHPIILPPKSPATRLIIRCYHIILCHASPSRTLSDLVQKFWIIHARSAITQVYNDCPDCRIRTAKPSPPRMAPLPSTRVKAFDPPFSVTGIDYFGPIDVIIFRRHVKRYGVIFTCLSTRAVHLEVSASLDTDSFLMAFRRFTNLRGKVAICYSDNGTNLVAGEKELKACLERWNQAHLTDQLAQVGVKWIFNPPAAPHFGGVWERLVQSAKAALKIVLRERPVSDEILATAFSEVTSLLNGRPLTFVSMNPEDLEPLTPNHLLLLRPQPALPPDVIIPSDINSRKRWRIAQAIADHFWKRWLREYLPFLTERRKWLQRSPPLKADDVVLVADPNTPRGHWPLGRVVEIYPARSGEVRSALVKTRIGSYVRPVAKLCLIETEESDSNPTSTMDSSSTGIGGDNVPTCPSE